MYRIFIALIFATCFNLTAYAEHPTAEHPSAPAVEAVSDDPAAVAVKALEAKGMSSSEASTTITDALTKAKEEGLNKEEIAAKLEGIVNNFGKAEQAAPEHPASEHPSK